MDHANFELKQLMAQEFPQGLSREDAAIHQSLIKETRRLATLTDQLMGELQAGARTSDIGQKLQFQLQEANNIHTRAQKAQSDVTAKYNQTLNGIAQNLKG
jgi:hypothetical protein